MRLITLLLFISTYAFSQVQPIQIEGNPNKGGFLQANILAVDGTDTLYFYEHVDSLGVADSIYLQGDSLILLKNGSGQVYKSRIYNHGSPDFAPWYYDLPNPQKYDIWVPALAEEEYTYYYDGSTWKKMIYDIIGNEGVIFLDNVPSYNNAVDIRSTGIGLGSKIKVQGDTLIRVSYDEIVPVLRLNIDTTQLNIRINNFISDSIATISDETQYLNPYVVATDTVGFYLTVAQDTVLFQNTIDTSAYCCPPSFANDTLYIGDNYVELPKENIIGGWGITATESPAYTWNIIADSSQVATQYDLSLVSGSQTLSIDSTNRVFTVSISGGNSVKFKDTGGVDSTTVVNSYGTTITESPANQFNITVDSSKFATTYDLSQVSGGGLPDYALLDHGSSSGNTQTLTLGTWNTITFSGAQESDSGVINADASTEEIEFVVAGTYRIEYFATWLANVSTYVLAGIYSDNGSAQLTKSQVQVRSQTGFLSTTVSKVFYHTAIAGETIKLQINPDSANHTSVGIYSYLIATKVN